MAKFLFTVWPFAGHVNPAIAIALALKERGHEVGFYSGATVQTAVTGEGFRFFPFERVDEARVIELASWAFPFSASLGRRLHSLKQLRANLKEWLLETVPQQVNDLNAVFSEWNPDVLVCDLSVWSPILVFHEARGIPVAVFSVLAACILPGPDVPTWGPGSPPPRTAMARARVRLARTLQKWLSIGFSRQVNALRRRYGLPPLDCSVTELAGRMPLYLVPSAPEYDYQRRDLPPAVQYVGPCLWDKPGTSLPPEWLTKLPDHQRLIYVTEATVGTTEPFLLKAAAAALRNMPVQVVMTTGKQRDPSSLGALPPNIRAESYVPQSDLLPKTSVMVTIGGSGGVLAALRAGVPLVIVPTEWDRPENAQRVVEAGAGIRIDANQCTPERLRAAVERVLNEPSFKRNALRLASAFARCEGPPRAAKLLEGLCTGTTAGSQLRKDVSIASAS